MPPIDLQPTSRNAGIDPVRRDPFGEELRMLLRGIPQGPFAENPHAPGFRFASYPGVT